MPVLDEIQVPDFVHEGEEAFRSAWRALAGVTSAPVLSAARERGRIWDWRLAAEESRLRLEKKNLEVKENHGQD